MAASAARIVGSCSCCCLANSTISTAFFTLMPGQHHEADLREDVVVQPAEINARDAAQQAHRHDQDDRRAKAQKLSYSAEWVRNTNNTHSGKINSAVLPACSSWYARFPSIRS